MRRLIPPVVAAIAALAIASTALAAGLSTIPLANGWQPEGIAAGRGMTAYVGSLADSGIARIDLRTGARNDDFVGSATGPAVGLEYEAGADRLWVAGGPSGEVRVYDASSGALLQTYSFGAGRFVNDIVVTRDAAYATDSFAAELLVVPLGGGGALPDSGAAFTEQLTGDWVQVAGFNSNGIEAFGGWLLIPNSTTGQLFAINPATGEATEVLPAGSIPAADGMLLIGSTLYVVQNQANLISVWGIHGGAVTLVGSIGEDDLPAGATFDVPTTIAFAGGSLWAANARFSTPPTPDTPYWITRVPLHSIER
jgi:hypothetical protein